MSHARNFSKNFGVFSWQKNFSVIVKNKSITIFLSFVYNLVSHRNDVNNTQNCAVKPLDCPSWFHSSFEHC